MVGKFSGRAAAFAVLGVLVQALVCVCAHGQSVLGGIHGVTRKAGGVPLPQAQVTLRNFEGTAERIVVSRADGTFSMENLAPGRYALEATKIGFANSRVVQVELAPGEELYEELTLGKKADHAPARKPKGQFSSSASCWDTWMTGGPSAIPWPSPRDEASCSGGGPPYSFFDWAYGDSLSHRRSVVQSTFSEL
jgi:hypothetical protein